MRKVVLILALAFTFSCYTPPAVIHSDDSSQTQFGVVCGSETSETYGTVVIGEQTWLASNLNCIPNTGSSWCYYGRSRDCERYGRLYNWATAMALPDSCNSNSCTSQIQPKHRGICPYGWHIPSKEEWYQLENVVDGDSLSTAGRKLKTTTGWKDCGLVGSGKPYVCENAFGFSGLPGGKRYSDRYFGGDGESSTWWAANENEDYGGSAYHWGLYYTSNHVYRGANDKLSNGFSVRCIKDL